MKIKLRVRVNDIRDRVERGEFIHFDNCTQVEIGKRTEFYEDREPNWPRYRFITNYFHCDKDLAARHKNPVNNKGFDEVHYMVRDMYITEQRIKKEKEKNPKLYIENPFHINTIAWKDRLTGKWHKLVFDTVCFLQNDQGDTLEKVEG